MSSEKGQTLIELIVAIAVSILVLGSLVFATITSLRNAQLAKNQSQATKLAQEGLEGVRSIRDRNGEIFFSYYSGSSRIDLNSFNQLWNVALRCDDNCHFYFNLGVLTGGGEDSFEDVNGFKRKIIMEDDTDGSRQKKVTAIVLWNDTTGEHESRLATILRNLL